MQNMPENSIILYKPIGSLLPNYSAIKEDDFLLGSMSEAQKKLLELYGTSCIMIDSTQSNNQYNFQLTTVMVHDENHEGLPVATFF